MTLYSLYHTLYNPVLGVHILYINYTQMGNVFRLHNRIEPSVALFWALGIVLAHILTQLTQPSGPALRPSPPPLFPSCCIYSMGVQYSNLKYTVQVLQKSLWIRILCSLLQYSILNSIQTN